MARVLITGMSGAGKSTLLAALAEHGIATVATDVDGWEVAPGVWDEPRMAALLAAHDTVAVAGTAENQGRFYDRFAEVVYLYAPLPVLLERVARRTNNPYGRAAAQRAEIAGYVATVEPLIRGGATTELDATAPVPELAHRVLRLLRD